MKAILIDAYRNEDDIILWLKTPEDNIRFMQKFCAPIYLEKNTIAEKLLLKHGVHADIVRKTTYIGEQKEVLEIKISKLSQYEQIIRLIEKDTKHRLIMYNADIKPEQLYLYKKNMKPFTLVEIQGRRIIPLQQEVEVDLQKSVIDIAAKTDIRANNHAEVKEITIDDKTITGDEYYLLKKFITIFTKKDPDVISIDQAFSKLPYLATRLEAHNLSCPFHRWDPQPITKKGGKTFFSYGKTMYREYATRLNGRFLIDANTTVGEECNVDGIMELSTLSKTRFQQIASRSFGAVFQSALVAEMVKRDYIVPFKEKPVDQPISLYHQLKFDRVGHTFDPKVGLHHDVAEIDFSSLFPWIIYNYNISTETLLRGDPPYQQVPGLPLKISLAKKGIVPTAIKPLIDRRMHYKLNPTSVNKARAMGLKWVLVTSYGYLRFREFKLGIASSHMAIGAFAREILLKAKEICEEHGCELIHGIVDSLYIKKKGITDEEVKQICREIELETGMPIMSEGIFKWIVFLPSVNDNDRPVPTRYYGVFKNGELKVRGMEVRQSGSPKIIKQFQHQVLHIMSLCETRKDIQEKFHYFCQLLRKYLFTLHTYPAHMLSAFIRVSKVKYKKNIPQKTAIELLNKKGITVIAGQKVHYLFSENGVQLPEDYDGKPDKKRYKRLFIRSLFVVLQPFGFTKKEISELVGYDRQSKLTEFIQTHQDLFEIHQVPHTLHHYAVEH